MAGSVIYSAISRPQMSVTLCCLSSILEHLFSYLSFILSVSNPSEHSPGSFFTFIYLVLAAGIPTPPFKTKELFPTPLHSLNHIANSSLQSMGLLYPIALRFSLFTTNGIAQKAEDFSFQWIKKILPFLYDLIQVPFL